MAGILAPNMLRLLLVVGGCGLAGCGPATQTFPLDAEGPKAKEAFAGLEACAQERGFVAKVSPKAVTVEMAPEQRIVFTLAEKPASVSMVTSVASDGARGALPRLKVLGDAVWRCAGGTATPVGSASNTTDPEATAEPAPSLAPSVAPPQPSVAPVDPLTDETDDPSDASDDATDSE